MSNGRPYWFPSQQAPGLQPDNTSPATATDHPGRMSVRHKKVPVGDTNYAESFAELEPGREVGWFFKNGEAVAIERQEGAGRDDELGE